MDIFWRSSGFSLEPSVVNNVVWKSTYEDGKQYFSIESMYLIQEQDSFESLDSGVF